MIRDLKALRDFAHEHGIAVDVADNAEKFIRAMPEDIPMPEFADEPDGNISLDWIRSAERVFSISVGGGSRLAWAWQNSGYSGHGVVGFDNQNIPDALINEIRAVAVET